MTAFEWAWDMNGRPVINNNTSRSCTANQPPLYYYADQPSAAVPCRQPSWSLPKQTSVIVVFDEFIIEIGGSKNGGKRMHRRPVLFLRRIPFFSKEVRWSLTSSPSSSYNNRFVWVWPWWWPFVGGSAWLMWIVMAKRLGIMPAAVAYYITVRNFFGQAPCCMNCMRSSRDGTMGR